MLIPMFGLMMECPYTGRCNKKCTGKCDRAELYEEHIKLSVR